MPALLLTDLRRMSDAELVARLSDEVYECQNPEWLESVRRITDELNDRLNIRPMITRTQSQEILRSGVVEQGSAGIPPAADAVI